MTEPEMSVVQAIELVARHALANRAEEVSTEWDFYPEIGEYDWRKVVDRVSALAPYPTSTEYLRASEMLARRANQPEPEQSPL